MASSTPATAQEVAELYGVAKSTIYRWYESNLFDQEPTVLPSPSGNRDRLLFDREAVGDQFTRELLDPTQLVMEETRNRRRAALEVFLDAD